MAMQNFEQLSRELERRGKTEEINKLAQSRDGQRISGMIDPQAVEKAARGGDTESLKNMLGRILETPEGKRLAESVKKMMEN
ncbi:MAG: hypothetical protein SPE18_12445 [Candidatus Limivicinus sp.]|nr:hypothetical protein [Candidatus Limivicinus sp.]